MLSKKVYHTAKYSLIGSVAELIVLMLNLIGLPKAFEKFQKGISVGFNAMFYIEILLCIAMVCISIYLVAKNQGEKRADTVEEMCRKGGVFIRFAFRKCSMLAENMRRFIGTVYIYHKQTEREATRIETFSVSIRVCSLVQLHTCKCAKYQKICIVQNNKYRV